MSEPDDAVQQAYRRSQRAHRSPSRIKRAIMVAANIEENDKSLFTRSKEWLPLASAAAVCVIMFGLFTLTSVSPPQTNDYIAVELHGYGPSDARTSQYAQRQARYFEDYQHKQRTLDIAQSRGATIAHVNGEFTFTDCNDTLIKVSSELMARLRAEQRISSSLNVGAQVELALNQDGYILQIRSAKGAVC